mgnify:CR=1 FL=1
MYLEGRNSKPGIRNVAVWFVRLRFKVIAPTDSEMSLITLPRPPKHITTYVTISAHGAVLPRGAILPIKNLTEDLIYDRETFPVTYFFMHTGNGWGTEVFSFRFIHFYKYN